MSRSGYSDDLDYNALNLWRGTVKRSIKGKRGQAFLKDLAKAMDAMPEKSLTRGALITPEGECCAIGAVCKARGIDVKDIDETEPYDVAKLVNIAPALAAEIAYENDDDFGQRPIRETPEERWIRMRKWVDEHIIKES